MEKYKKYLYLGLAEVIILICAILFSVYNFNHLKQTICYGQDLIVDINTGENTPCVDTSYENYESKYIGINNIVLEKGAYCVEIQYESTCNAECVVEYANKKDDYNLSGSMVLEKFNNILSQTIVVDRKEQPLEIFCKLGDDVKENDYLVVKEISIRNSFVGDQIRLFKLFLIMIIVDIAIYIHFWKIFTKEKRIIIAGIASIVFISCIPLMTDYLLSGHDLAFHLARIEGIKNGLLDGQFPVRIQPQWLNGHGYPVSIFYGDLFLYIPAMLRIVGFTLQDSYKIFIVVVNVATAIISYMVFREIGNGNKKVGLFASALYTLGLYRIGNIYIRAAVGEYTAMIFFPIVLYGLWYVFSRKREELKSSKIWVVLAIGYLGILNSHLISCVMVGIFTVISCIFMVKQVFQKERFVLLFKACIALILAGLGFLIPLLEYRSMNFKVNAEYMIDAYLTDERGLFWGQFFSTDYNVQSINIPSYMGMVEEMPLTLGMNFLVILASVVIIIFCNYHSILEKKELVIAILLNILAMFMCTKYFPYTEISRLPKLWRITNVLVKNIEFPWRFMVIVSLISVWLVVIILTKVDWKEIGVDYKKGVIYTIAILLFIEVMNMSGEVMNHKEPIIILSEANMPSMQVAWEYLYEDNDYEKYTNQITNVEAGVDIIEWKKENGKVIVEAFNSSKEENEIELPLILYKGYQAKDLSSEKEINLKAGESNRIRLVLPSNYAGIISVGFVSPWYWRVAEIITIATYLYMIFVLLGKDKLRNNVFN